MTRTTWITWILGNSSVHGVRCSTFSLYSYAWPLFYFSILISRFLQLRVWTRPPNDSQEHARRGQRPGVAAERLPGIVSFFVWIVMISWLTGPSSTQCTSDQHVQVVPGGRGSREHRFRIVGHLQHDMLNRQQFRHGSIPSWKYLEFYSNKQNKNEKQIF